MEIEVKETLPQSFAVAAEWRKISAWLNFLSLISLFVIHLAS